MKPEEARGWKLTRSQRRARRNHRLTRTGSMADEHTNRARGWRVTDGRVELWFSACSNDFHGIYAPTCSYCNAGLWQPTSVVLDDTTERALAG